MSARPWLLRLVLAAVLPWIAYVVPATGAEEEPLRFVRRGETVRTLAGPEIQARCDVRTVEVPRDPYYGRPKRYRACPLRRVLELGLGGLPEGFADATVLLRALDGYTRPVHGATLLEEGGFLALADAGREASGLTGWEPIDRRRVDPGPFYMVWTGAGQGDPHAWPWPYQLAAIEVVAFEERFPHVLPRGAAEGSAARRGFAIFRRACLACHAVNGQGGTVGPELNVPRSIVEYRPEEQIKAYVRDPARFRYTSMPPHPELDDGDLDDLIAYFRHMRDHKHDPHADAGP
ncbi:MAG: c-type cytochrome [Myxococcota bacterium]|nr:c-type cytochrome [Myxococcota bacterium]